MIQVKSLILHETLLSYDIGNNYIQSINEDLYTSLASYLSKEDIKKTAQPNLIVGETGSGKTFLIKRLHNRIKEEFNNTLQPIVIEGKTLFSTEDIWSQCLSLLKKEQSVNSFDSILQWQEENSKRIVLFIDNVQYYFNRTNNSEQFGLRGKLNKNGAPILIACSERVLPQITEYNAAFFDGFKITYLKPIPLSTIETIINNKYDITRIKCIMSYLPQTIRSIIIAREILEKSPETAKDLEFLSDYFYYHYHERFNAVSTQTQRILSVLSLSDSGLTLSGIREMTGQDNGKISPYLKLLTEQNLIKKEAKTLRGGIYSIIDPLFKLWLLHNTVRNSCKTV